MIYNRPRRRAKEPTLAGLAIGDSVFMNLSGTKTEFLVVHHGKPSAMYDESCNGSWILLKGIYKNRQWNSDDKNDYANSSMHWYLNDPFLAIFDSNIKNIIKQVKLPYRKGNGQGGADQSGANGLVSKIFLLSAREVGFSTGFSLNTPDDGAKLDYFPNDFSEMSKRIATLNGVASRWWLRSPYTENDTATWDILASGIADYDSTSNAYGVRPALILPSDAKVDEDHNIIG